MWEVGWGEKRWERAGGGGGGAGRKGWSEGVGSRSNTSTTTALPVSDNSTMVSESKAGYHGYLNPSLYGCVSELGRGETFSISSPSPTFLSSPPLLLLLSSPSPLLSSPFFPLLLPFSSHILSFPSLPSPPSPLYLISPHTALCSLCPCSSTPFSRPFRSLAHERDR